MNPRTAQTDAKPLIRAVRESELTQLLDLYKHLHAEDFPLPPQDQLLVIWRSICANPNVTYIVADAGGSLVASCVLAVIPNLTRGARPYALIENVVTHSNYRKQGLGTAVLHHAVEIARTRGCYKVMLMTGSKRPETLRFYEHAGFTPKTKTSFVMRLE